MDDRTQFARVARALSTGESDVAVDDMITPLGFEFAITPTSQADGSELFVERWRRYFRIYHAMSATLVLMAVGVVVVAVIDNDPAFMLYAAPLVIGGAFGSAITWVLARRTRTARVTPRQVEWTMGAQSRAAGNFSLYICNVQMRNYHTLLPWSVSGCAVILATPEESMTIFLSTRRDCHERIMRYVESLPAIVRQRVITRPMTLRCWSTRRQ